MTECRADFETRSDVDLRKRGAHPYFASRHFRPLGLTYRLGGPLRDWEFGQPCPADLAEHIRQGGYFRAFNASFERKCFRELTQRWGWPAIADDRFRCTAAEAAAMGLPRKLDHLAQALGLDAQKDKEGMRLIRKFSMPRRPRKDEDPDGIYWNEPEDHPADYALFVSYRQQDVIVEEEAAKRLVPLSDNEQRVYTLTERINDRGIRIDRRSCRAALALAEKAKKLLDREMRICTNGYVGGVTQPGKLVEWVQSQGVAMDSAQKAEIESMRELDDLPAHVRRAIEIRQEGAKSSVSKLQAFLDRASADGRVRGTDIYHAASTGRTQSVGINKNNMPRPRREFDDAHLDTSVLFDAIRSEDPELLKLLYGYPLGRPLNLISDAIRGFLWAAPGHEFLQADYSGIEGAVIAWSSGEDWKVAALHAIIADPSLPDMYRRTAANILNLSVDTVTKKHWARQAVGKVSELALGFGGGVAAFHSMSLNYSVKLDPLFAPVWETAPEERREKAVKRHESRVKLGKEKADILSREAWLACELIKVGWRASNPAIAKGWHTREDAMREAIRNPGAVVHCLKFSYVVKMGYLWCKLPSGRCLAYASPKLRDQVWAAMRDGAGWADAEVMDRLEAEKLALQGLVRIDGPTSPAITILGVGKDGKMRREMLYGGLAAENDTQAVARDLLVNGMWKAEGAGYPIVGTIYDEIVCEVPRGWGDLAAFEKLICELPPWADGMPLTAGGFRAKRYKKD